MYGASVQLPHRPCSACHWFDGWHACGIYALCTHPLCCRVRSQPERGCCSFEREPGSDDELVHAPGMAPSLVPLNEVAQRAKWAP